MVHDRFLENYEFLKAQAKEAALMPGVYIWRDGENRMIYVGKARILRNRLVSYFSGRKDVKTAALIKHAISIETIITSNEYEALLLENTLIKQHSPKYNINLKDGKTYPVIRLSAGDFPRVFRTRHIIEDGSLYFGPFPNVNAVDKTLEIIEKLFPLRKCRKLKKRESPCMYYHIKRCDAPCCGRIGREQYQTHVEKVRKLLAGETSALTGDLTARMNKAAAELKFEEAAEFRNAIRAVSSLSENNSVADMDPQDRDYIAWAYEGIFTTFSVLSMRGGRMTGRELYNSRSAAEEDESLETFIAAYYSPDRPPPPKIYLAGSLPSENAEKPLSSGNTLGQYFSVNFALSPDLIFPGTGDGEKRHHAALAMAYQNAAEELRKRMRERGAGPALDELARGLKLKIRPERIEGFDISHLDGKHPVASLVSFRNGIPDRKNYRHFKLRTVKGIVDDYASIREAVKRRYSRLAEEGRELPDLILVDGGIGQANAAWGVLNQLGIDCALAGLAKENEEIWLPHSKSPIILPRDGDALKVLQFVRDETHRFATKLNQKLRSGDIYFSALESVEGIGPKRAAAMMKAYGSLEKIAQGDPCEISQRCGIAVKAAGAARAAVRLALENSRAPGKGAKTSAAMLAAEAAEKTPDYDP